jgi:hypothetical protein
MRDMVGVATFLDRGVHQCDSYVNHRNQFLILQALQMPLDSPGAEPSVVASLVSYLAGPESSFTTGMFAFELLLVVASEETSSLINETRSNYQCRRRAEL